MLSKGVPYLNCHSLSKIPSTVLRVLCSLFVLFSLCNNLLKNVHWPKWFCQNIHFPKIVLLKKSYTNPNLLPSPLLAINVGHMPNIVCDCIKYVDYPTLKIVIYMVMIARSKMQSNLWKISLREPFKSKTA